MQRLPHRHHQYRASLRERGLTAIDSDSCDFHRGAAGTTRVALGAAMRAARRTGFRTASEAAR